MMRRPKVLAAAAGLLAALLALVLVLVDADGLVLVLLTAVTVTTLVWSVVTRDGARIQRQVAALDARQAVALEALRREIAELRDERGVEER